MCNTYRYEYLTYDVRIFHVYIPIWDNVYIFVHVCNTYRYEYLTYDVRIGHIYIHIWDHVYIFVHVCNIYRYKYLTYDVLYTSFLFLRRGKVGAGAGVFKA